MTRRTAEQVPLPAKVYTLAVLGAAAFLAREGIVAALSRPAESLTWIVLLALAGLLTVPILPGRRIVADLNQPIIVASAVVLPPPLAILVNFFGFTNESFRRGALSWLSIFNRTQVALSAGVAAWIADIVGDGIYHEVLAPLAMTGAAIIVQDFTSILLISVAAPLLRRMSWLDALRVNMAPFPRFASTFLLVGLLAVPVVLAYPVLGVLAVVLLVLPLALGYNAMRSAKESEDRAQALARQVRELQTLNMLGEQLLSVRAPEAAIDATRRALSAALDDERVIVARDGLVPQFLERRPVPGAEPAAIGVPKDVAGASLAVVDAVADLLGVTLQRLDLSTKLSEVQQARAALAGRILEEGTRERSRIALEIHDDVLPYLAGAEIQADNVRSAIDHADLAVADHLAKATSSAINGGIAQLRQVLDALRKQIIVPGSLVPALREAVDDLQLRHGIDGEVGVPHQLPQLPLAVEILVLETVRGCLTNVARHARARHVQVRVECSDSSLTAMVCDDGVGFDPDAVPAGHHGLSLMAQRVELARGRFTITSEAGRGTTVAMEVPL